MAIENRNLSLFLMLTKETDTNNHDFVGNHLTLLATSIKFL